MEKLGLVASRLGLDPLHNSYACPIVYHERYSFPEWPENHTFPMNKFERTANALLTTSSVSTLGHPLVKREQDFFRPIEAKDVPVEEWLCSIIDPDFVRRFLKGKLTTEEALMAEVKNRKISRKINYDAMSSIFDDEGTFANDTTTQINEGGMEFGEL